MSLGGKLARRSARPPLADPFADDRPGYSQPDAIDPSGYAIGDRYGPPGDGEVPDVPRSRPPRWGGMLGDTGYGDEDDDDGAHPGGALGEVGAAWRSDDFAMPSGEWIGGQHAVRPAVVEFGDSGVVEQHAQRSVGDIYSGRAPRRVPAAPLEYEDDNAAPAGDGDVDRSVYGVSSRVGLPDPGIS